MITTVGYGVSESLLSLFDGLRQISRYSDDSLDAPRKHHDSDIDKVVQHICCRNYGFLCRELCFLSWAVQQACSDPLYNEPLYRFFWLDDITSPAAFRHAFAQPWKSGDCKVEMPDSVLHLESGNTVFDISPTRSGILAVMMEFIASINPEHVQHLKSLRNGNVSDIDALAKQLQKSLYDYLKDHLPEAQEHNRYRYVADWLNQQALTPEAVNDAAVMLFWQQANEDDSANKPSHVRFETAVDDVLDTLFALSVIKLQNAARFGASTGVTSSYNTDNSELDLGRIDVSGGNEPDDEFSPEFVQSALFDDVETEISLASLTEAPKCLTQAQAQLLKPLVVHKTHLARFTHTLLRLQVFGPWQAVLSQAKRKSAAAVAEKLSALPDGGYQAYLNQVGDSAEAIIQVRGCMHHVLLLPMPQTVLSELITQLPAPPETVKAWLIEHVVNTESSAMPAKLEQAALQWPALKACLDDNARRFKANNKAGFKTMPHENDCDPYYHALQQLNKLAALLASHTGNVAEFLGNDNADQIFASDVSIFSDRFQSMYGDVHV